MRSQTCFFVIILSILLNFSPIYSDDLKYLENSFLNHKIQDLPSIAQNLSGLGSVYQSRGEYQKAIVHYMDSLTLREQIGMVNTPGYALVLSLIAISHYRLGNSCEALYYSEKAITIYRYLGNEEINDAIEINKSSRESCQLSLN